MRSSLLWPRFWPIPWCTTCPLRSARSSLSLLFFPLTVDPVHCLVPSSYLCTHSPFSGRREQASRRRRITATRLDSTAGVRLKSLLPLDDNSHACLDSAAETDAPFIPSPVELLELPPADVTACIASIQHEHLQPLLAFSHCTATVSTTPALALHNAQVL